MAHAGYPFGYHLIFLSPPYPASHVDILRLGLEWIMASAIAAGFYFAWPLQRLPVPLGEIQPGYIFQSVEELYIVSRIDEQKVVYFYGIKKGDENCCHISDFDSIVDQDSKK